MTYISGTASVAEGESNTAGHVFYISQVFSTIYILRAMYNILIHISNLWRNFLLTFLPNFNIWTILAFL